ncbi:IclR family transcriptional regulator [Haloplanus rubicundus]|uniref:IclR family transcriptional regulator n=1 Tax=Haloplanus rubicundus TaxID=1547898 RepID=A0A345E2H7_9EURY|nr:IclR family transcriptional regulator [Haloplanus rubicundus]AXG06399.1 IclR family transcriptional regulator [Haloplanus rubicundus]
MTAEPNPDGSPRTLKTVERTAQVIKALETLDGAGVTELATHLDMSKSSTYHYLATLREEDFVVKNGDQYELGLQLLLSGEYVRNRNLLYRYGKEEVEELAETTGEYANLFTEQHGKGINLYKVRGSDAVGSGYQTDKLQQPDQLHCTATGKAILAFLPEDRVDDILDEHGLPERTENTITDRDELHDELATVRERGYAYNDEEEVEGLRAVGAPVIDRDDTVLGSLSVAGPTSRLKGTPFDEELPEQVQRAANVIEVNINMATHGSESRV